MNSGRDLIDFLILLGSKAKFFYALVVLNIIIAVFVTNQSGNTYFFEKILTLSPASNFSSIYSFQKAVFDMSKIDSSGLIGREEADNIIQTLFNDSDFYELIALEYINSKYNNNSISEDEILKNIQSSINFKSIYKWRFGLKVKANNESIELFLRHSLNDIVNQSIAVRFNRFLLDIKKTALRYLEARSRLEVERIKLGYLDQRNSGNFGETYPKVKVGDTGILVKPVKNKDPYSVSQAYQDLINLKAMSVPSVDLRYSVDILVSSSKKPNMNIYLSISLSIFLPMLIYFLVVLFSDMKEQVKIRKSIDNNVLS